MKRRDSWRIVLDAELKKWRAKSFVELVAALSTEKTYEIEFEGKEYQVEVQLLENTDQHVNVSVAVDDGSIPASFRPLCSSFRVEKQELR